MDVLLLYCFQNKVDKRNMSSPHRIFIVLFRRTLQMLFEFENEKLLTAKMYACVGEGHITMQRSTERMQNWAPTQESPWKTILELIKVALICAKGNMFFAITGSKSSPCDLKVILHSDHSSVISIRMRKDDPAKPHKYASRYANYGIHSHSPPCI